ncbi:MAG: DUF4405 domain-containing protein [Planctomycetia bacterium]|nr:DUF4405 domain-containing protein [Planctomycetia bacterium]
MKTPLNLLKFRIDIFLFLGMVVLSLHSMTGDMPHEWLGVLFVPLLIAHLYVNWDWLVYAVGHFFRAKTSLRVRFNLLLDLLLYLTMGIVVLSGILISRDFLFRLGISIPNDGFVSYMHKRSVLVLFALLGIHLGMHVTWIWNNFGRYISGTKGKDEK